MIMDDSTLTILALLKTHAWAPLSILVMLWIYRALSDDSKFPITWPAGWGKWKPLVIITLGQAICVVKAITVSHVMWYIAVEHGAIISFMALGGVHILKNFWPVEGTEPKWLRYFVLVFSKVVAVAEMTVTVAQESKDEEPVVSEKAKLTVPKS